MTPSYKRKLLSHLVLSWMYGPMRRYECPKGHFVYVCVQCRRSKRRFGPVVTMRLSKDIIGDPKLGYVMLHGRCYVFCPKCAQESPTRLGLIQFFQNNVSAYVAFIYRMPQVPLALLKAP